MKSHANKLKHFFLHTCCRHSMLLCRISFLLSHVCFVFLYWSCSHASGVKVKWNNIILQIFSAINLQVAVDVSSFSSAGLIRANEMHMPLAMTERICSVTAISPQLERTHFLGKIQVRCTGTTAEHFSGTFGLLCHSRWWEWI